MDEIEYMNTNELKEKNKLDDALSSIDCIGYLHVKQKKSLVDKIDELKGKVDEYGFAERLAKAEKIIEKI